MSPKIALKRSKSCVFLLEKSGNYPFLFWLLLRGKCINEKKVNVKTLPRPYTKRNHQMVHSKMCHMVYQPDKHAVSNLVFKATRIIYKLDRRFKKYFMGKSAAYLKQILFAAANISYIYGEKSCLYPTPNL